MTVGDLMEQLKQVPEDLPVRISSMHQYHNDIDFIEVFKDPNELWIYSKERP
jgi:tRNA A37 methylthiotransferase MiaB